MSDPVENANKLLEVQASYQALAKTAYDMFNAFKIGGFNETQALYMTSQWLNNVIQSATQNGKK